MLINGPRAKQRSIRKNLVSKFYEFWVGIYLGIRRHFARFDTEIHLKYDDSHFTELLWDILSVQGKESAR